MTEFVEKRCENMIPELEQMKGIKLFNKNEIKCIAKKIEEYEYKIQQPTKCKEDYLLYIQYEMNLLKLIKQRREKYYITQNKLDIDFAIANKMNNLYKDAIYRFQDEIRFWIAYIKFCKHMHFHSNISNMLSRMLQVHRDKPECWYIAACWELEENNSKQNACLFLLRGLHIHPKSQLLHMNAFKLELGDRTAAAANNTDNTECVGNSSSSLMDDSNEMSLPLRKAYAIFQQAFERIKDIKFIIKLLDVAQEYDNTEKLREKIKSDLMREYAHESVMWDLMARRELQGLIQPGRTDTSKELDNSEQAKLKDRIASCNKVYQTAVKKIKSEEMWSLYIECLLEINSDLQSLSDFKKKLLKIALVQAHQSKKLKEKYYLHWIEMLNVDNNKNKNAQKKLERILCEAVDAIPNSVSLWHLRTRNLLISGREKEATTVISKATKVLKEKALPLWRLRILHVQKKIPEKMEETFQAALQAHPLIAGGIKTAYIEWLVLTKNICATRKVYKALCQQPSTPPEFHEKMAAFELIANSANTSSQC